MRRSRALALILCGAAVAALAVGAAALLFARRPDTNRGDPAALSAPRGPMPDTVPTQNPDAWLDVNDPRPPELWLVRRTHRLSEIPEDIRVVRVSALLSDADRAYHENRRMIANRIAQIVDISEEYGQPILPEDILSDLTFPESRGRQWLGIVVQAYIELRRGGAPHDEAVRTVRRTFGEGGTRE